jgi:hypothetical protein
VTRVFPATSGFHIKVWTGSTWRTIKTVGGGRSDAEREARRLEERTATLREYHARNDGGTE